MEHQKIVVEYTMCLKRKQRAKLEGKECAEGHYHQMFYHKMKSSSDLLKSNTHKDCHMLNTTDYNYKLRSVIGQENDSTVDK